jgi:hypothetical protein
MDVCRFMNKRGGLVDFAFGVDQVKRIEEVGTLVIMITCSILIITNQKSPSTHL